MDDFAKIFLPIYFIVYNVMVFVLPSYIVYKRTGKNPYVFGKSNNLHDMMGKLSKVIIIILFAAVIINSFFPELNKWMIPIPYLENGIISFGGISLLMASFCWTIIAVNQMSNSWRIGLDRENKTELITTGLFKHSRNPVFFGMAISMIGIFMMLPNAVTLLSCLLYITFANIQIELEEEFLVTSFGEEYVNYKTKVKRWIGQRRIKQ